MLVRERDASYSIMPTTADFAETYAAVLANSYEDSSVDEDELKESRGIEGLGAPAHYVRYELSGEVSSVESLGIRSETLSWLFLFESRGEQYLDWTARVLDSIAITIPPAPTP